MTTTADETTTTCGLCHRPATEATTTLSHLEMPGSLTVHPECLPDWQTPEEFDAWWSRSVVATTGPAHGHRPRLDHAVRHAFRRLRRRR